MMTRSPLIWFGGKSKLARELIARMPPHSVYVEPFGGAAHVIAAKPAVSTEVYNDIDGEAVNFLLVARADTERLIEAADALPYSRAVYELWRDEPWPTDEFTRAVRWFYINRSGIAKGNRERNTGWRHSGAPGTNPARSYYGAVEAIREFAQRMRNVQIECRDFREVIEVYDGHDAMFYIDPPYVGREKRYVGNFTEQDHRDLANMLHNIKGRALVSYYEHPLILELYDGWGQETLGGYVQSVGGSEPRPARELVLTNYGAVQQSLLEV